MRNYISELNEKMSSLDSRVCDDNDELQMLTMSLNDNFLYSRMPNL